MLKTYLRLLGYARPIRSFIGPYLVFSLLHVLFGLFNFAMLIPVLDVLFNSGNPMLVAPATPPAPSFSAEYVTGTFNYYLYQQIAAHGKMGALYFVCGALVVSVLLSNIFRYLSIIISEATRARMVRNLRTSVYNHVLSLHLGYFSNERKGDILSRITADVTEVEVSITETVTALLKEPPTLIAYFYTLILISPELTLFTLILLPLSGAIIGIISKQLRRTARAAQESLGMMVSLVEEALGGVRVIKAFNAAPYQKARFLQESQRYADLAVKMARKREAAPPFSEFSGVLVICVILIYGGSLVLGPNPSLKASGFIAYLALFSQVLRPAKQISQSFSQAQRGIASGERIFQVLDARPQVTSPPDGRKFDGLQADIEFRDLTFAYEPERPVLNGINLTLRKGQSLALVGPSGSGKSTLADLLLRFYDPSEGSILVDSIDLRHYNMESVRARIGLVSQETVLFNDTVFNNIAFCKPGATAAEVERAARIASAHTFISEMPQGYDTPIGDRGTRLSGGQRQRLAIARAVLLDPEILVLDEATSALDTESERLVQAALAELLKGRTSLIIAHRLSTIRDADSIAVLDRGTVRQLGTHAELMSQPEGLYYRLAVMQEES